MSTELSCLEKIAKLLVNKNKKKQNQEVLSKLKNINVLWKDINNASNRELCNMQYRSLIFIEENKDISWLKHINTNDNFLPSLERYFQNLEMHYNELIKCKTDYNDLQESEIIKDLEILLQNNPEITIHKENNNFIIDGYITSDINLECPETGKVFEFGKFKVKLCLNSGGRNLHFEALTPNFAEQEGDKKEHPHPHILNGELCEGEATLPLRLALEEGRFIDFFDIIESVLDTYNPSSPYVSLHEWNNCLHCSICNNLCHLNELRACCSCNERICEDCRRLCGLCDEYVCEECSLYCPQCNEIICHSHSDECTICGETLCSECLIRCERCEGWVCKEDCSHECFCCEKTICNSCGSSDCDCIEFHCEGCDCPPTIDDDEEDQEEEEPIEEEDSAKFQTISELDFRTATRNIMANMYPPITTIGGPIVISEKVGTEPGMLCNRQGSDGKLCPGIIEGQEGKCKCSSCGNPPCSFCENHYVSCPECGWENSD